MLFHLSTTPNLTELTPRIPNTGYGPKEDNTIARVCFAPTIGKCIRAICAGLYDDQIFHKNDYHSDEYIVNGDSQITLDMMADTSDIMNMLQCQFVNFADNRERNTVSYPLYHVYVPLDVRYSEVYKPSPYEVYDVEYTNEVWLTRPCKVQQVCSIIVTSQFIYDTVTLPTRNGTQEYDLIEYNWRVLDHNTACIYESSIAKWSKLCTELFFTKLDKEKTPED